MPSAKEASVEAIHGAVGALSASGTARAGYVIDFGVLDTGEIALIELNDGFSFGAYMASPQKYIGLSA